MKQLLSMTTLLLVFFSPFGVAKDFVNHTNMMNHGDGHLMDMGGAMVMGQNTDTLPGGCDKIAAVEEITVHAGHQYAEKFPGRMFAFDKQEWNFKPCTKLTVHFINDDEIRHQFMMHGLPRYLYPKGMFHLEVTGPGEVSGTLIFPPNDKTYLVHCDISQHMEKGMKAELKIGQGSGDLPSIPGLTANVIQDDYSQSIPDLVPVPDPTTAAKNAVAANPTNAGNGNGRNNGSFISGITVIGLAVGFLLAPILAKKFKGMTFGESLALVFEWISLTVGFIVRLIINLIKKFTSKKPIELPKK